MAELTNTAYLVRDLQAFHACTRYFPIVLAMFMAAIGMDVTLSCGIGHSSKFHSGGGQCKSPYPAKLITLLIIARTAAVALLVGGFFLFMTFGEYAFGH